MSDTPSFGQWLRQRRRSHDLTQTELARQVGCAVGTLRNIEADDARPSKQLAARLARVLGVAEDDVPAVVAFARGSGPAPDATGAAYALPLSPAASTAGASRTPRTPHPNLPAQLTTLIGRTREVDEVRALLLRPDVRLVTLTGSGGTGKTRVAVQVVAGLPDSFPDGIYFVDLAAITDPDLVLATVAQTLGVADGGQPLGARLAAALRDQSLLLLLDNFEQVVEAGPAVVGVLAACPDVKALITSRVALGVAGEYAWPVPPLPLPDRAHLPPFEQITQYESVRLFSERAYAANPAFAITTGNAPAVAEICYQLDGLPLAIELVAAWARLFEPRALLARLDHRLTYLTGGGRDRPTRQQTMRNTIDWSYRLLTPAEQLLFRRVSVFMGGATLPAIDAVCGGDGDVVARVSALASQSLLRILPGSSDGVESEPRIGMFETIREYALEQLAASPEAETIRRRHADYFMALAVEAAAQWTTPTVDAWIEKLNRENDNMRAALQWARDGGNGLIGLRLAGALWKFWQGYGYTSEGRVWLDHLLTLDDPHPDSTTMVARLCGLQAAAWLASGQNDDAHATQLLDQSMLLRRALRETTGETNPLVNAARQARTEGQYRQAVAALEEALSRHRMLRERIRHGDADLGLAFYDLGLVLRVLGLVRREQGAFAQAAALFDENLTMQRRFGDREGTAFALLGLADVARDLGDAARVREYGEESLAILRDLRIQWAIGFALNTLAQAAYVDGDLARAFALIDESVALFRELKAYSSLAEVLITQGYIVGARGNATAAYEALAGALRLAWAVGPRVMAAAALEGLAGLEIARGQARRTIQLLAAASALRARMGTPVRPVDRPAVDRALAAARAALGADDFAAIWAEAEALPPEQIVSALPGVAAFDVMWPRSP
jgi:predicted ATPase/transcriptional regulator with XRE-family HTH domain